MARNLLSVGSEIVNFAETALAVIGIERKDDLEMMEIAEVAPGVAEENDREVVLVVVLRLKSVAEVGIDGTAAEWEVVDFEVLIDQQRLEQ